MTQDGPNSPQNHPKRSLFLFNRLGVINVLYNNSTGSSLNGRCWGGNCLKSPQNGKKRQILQMCYTVQFVQYDKTLVKYLRCITRIRRMTHPWYKLYINLLWGNSTFSELVSRGGHFVAL